MESFHLLIRQMVILGNVRGLRALLRIGGKGGGEQQHPSGHRRVSCGALMSNVAGLSCDCLVIVWSH